MSDIIDVRTGSYGPVHYGHDRTLAEVALAERDPYYCICDGAAVTVAAWYQSPSRDDDAFSQLASTGRTSRALLRAAIAREMAQETSATYRRALQALDRWARWTGHWHVGTNTPGCLPDSDITCTKDAIEAAVAFRYDMRQTLDLVVSADAEFLAHDTWLHVNDHLVLAEMLVADDGLRRDVQTDGGVLAHWVEPVDGSAANCTMIDSGPMWEG